VEIQMRKGYVSLHTSRRKFAQVTRANRTSVDVTLRLEAQIGERLKAVKTADSNAGSLTAHSALVIGL
jgi:hypothetical protein